MNMRGEPRMLHESLHDWLPELMPEFVAAGEAMTCSLAYDEQGTHCVGQAPSANWRAACAMANLGVPSAFAGAVGADAFGESLWQASAGAGLDLRFLQRPGSCPAPDALARNLAQHCACDRINGDMLDPQALPPGWKNHVRWVHFSGTILARPRLAVRLVALAESLNRRGVRLSFDPHYRDLRPLRFDATLRRMTELADVVMLCDEDLAGLFCSGDLRASFTRLRSWNPQAAFLHLGGANGTSLHAGGAEWHATAHEASAPCAPDADATLAGLAYSMMYRGANHPAEHLRYAIAAGACAGTDAAARCNTGLPSHAGIARML